MALFESASTSICSSLLMFARRFSIDSLRSKSASSFSLFSSVNFPSDNLAQIFLLSLDQMPSVIGFTVREMHYLNDSIAGESMVEFIAI